MEQADAWKQAAATPGALPAVRPELDTYATAEQLVGVLDAETTRMLLAEVPAAFHAGIHDILLIAFGLAWAECSWAAAARRSASTSKATGATRNWPRWTVDLSRTVGWFTTKYPVSLRWSAGVSWAQVRRRRGGAGGTDQGRQRATSRPTRPPDLWPAALPERRRRPRGSDPPIGFNYLGRLGAAAVQASGDLWWIGPDGMSMTGAAAAVPMPLAHTLELNAGRTVDTETGPHLHANWTWAPSALDHAAVTRLSQLWFEPLTGICAHVRSGGGGLTPSDIAPARLSQQQIDELQQQHRIADILPLTPLQQGLLFHARAAHGDDDMYAVQLDFTVTGAA